MSNVQCSCIVCKRIFNGQLGLRNHFMKAHSEIQEKYRKILKKEYTKHPCKQCNKKLQETNSIIFNKFCSSSCAAKYNNKRRVRSEESKRKISKIMKGINKLNQPPPYTEIKYGDCEWCGTPFLWNSITKGSKRFCSADCTHKYIGKKTSIRLSNPANRINYGRGRKSYMEDTFMKWLDKNGIKNYHMEYHIKNEELNKNYYVDFFFPDLNLIVELDGTQHERTKIQDSIRDQYIKRTYNYTVLRISIHEYIKKTKMDYIKSILGIR